MNGRALPEVEKTCNQTNINTSAGVKPTVIPFYPTYKLDLELTVVFFVVAFVLSPRTDSVALALLL